MLRAGHLARTVFSFAALTVVAAVIATVPRADAQTPAPSPSSIVGEIHATGSSHYNTAQVAAACGLKPGDKVTRERLQQAADRLAAIGVFNKVNYKYTPHEDKIDVEFQLTDALAAPVLFDNFPWFTQEALTAAIQSAVPIFDGTAPESGTILDDMTAAISKLLAARGIAGTVEHQWIAQAVGDGMIMQFRVDGADIMVASIAYGDALARDSEKLRDRTSDLVGKPYSQFAIDVFENEQVRPLYLEMGQIRVEFGSAEVHLAEDPGQTPSQASVVLPIDPGPVFHMSTVSWNGQTVLPEATLATLLDAKPGDLADGMKFQAGIQAVENEYAHRGYLDMKLDAKPQFDDAVSTVTYHIAINEGPQYRMGSLVITGLSVESEAALHRYWHLAPGAIFDGTYSNGVIGKLERPTGEVFGNIPLHYTEFGHWLRANPDTRTVDVLMDFK